MLEGENEGAVKTVEVNVLDAVCDAFKCPKSASWHVIKHSSCEVIVGIREIHDCSIRSTHIYIANGIRRNPQKNALNRWCRIRGVSSACNTVCV